MVEQLQIDEGDLRRFMRDPRYWQSGNPERQAHVDWVTRGFQALYGEGNATKAGSVWVEPYSCVRNGRKRMSPAIGDPTSPARAVMTTRRPSRAGHATTCFPSIWKAVARWAPAAAGEPHMNSEK